MLLHPTTKPIGSVKHLLAVVDVDSIGTYNWAKFVLPWLCDEKYKMNNKASTKDVFYC